MFNWIIGTMVALLVVQFALLLYWMAKFKSGIVDYVTPSEEGKPSPLAQTFELFAEMIARSLMAQVKGFLMAQESAEKRSQYAMDDAGNPLSSLVPRSLRRNPLMAIATKFLAAKLGGYKGLPGDNHQNASVEAPKFKL